MTAQDGSVYDSSGEVKLWSLKSGADIDQLFASGALGIGRLQPDGSCEFRLNLEFPTPPTPPDGYLITVSPADSPVTRTQRYDPALVSKGRLTRFTVDLYG